VAFFRRRNSAAEVGASQVETIAAFWSWWQDQGARESAQAIADGEPERMVGPLSRRVHAIDPGLAWELAPGTAGGHVLVVTSQGVAELRAVARRWRRAGPAADAVWEYSDSRPPVADPAGTVLTLGDTELDLGSAIALARVSGADLDVAVYHPAFIAMPDDERRVATFLMLDTVLGESAMETWIGTVDVAPEPPMDPVPLAGLRSVVRELSDRFTDAEGAPNWALMRGMTPDGHAVLASAQIPLRAASAPHLDTYVGVEVQFSDVTAEGLPGDGSLSALRDLEEHLNGRLGGSGRIVAHQTHQGARTFHVYVDGTTPAVEQLRAAIVGWDQGGIEVGVRPDPAWNLVRHLRG
jgi:hypothetical protein